MTSLPILYSFRRCPYAMRARMAIAASGQVVELREVLLRDKPQEMIEASPKATVPILIETDGGVLDESLDIMLWALRLSDPGKWLVPDIGDLDQMLTLITRMDGPFKTHLDNYKYAARNGQIDAAAFAIQNRDAAMIYLAELNERLQDHDHLFGKGRSLADVAIAPFVRQFANTDADWFAGQHYSALQRWLTTFVESDLFVSVMDKYARWDSGTLGVSFPERSSVETIRSNKVTV